jgi:hypothetical protein
MYINFYIQCSMTRVVKSRVITGAVHHGMPLNERIYLLSFTQAYPTFWFSYSQARNGDLSKISSSYLPAYEPLPGHPLK